MMNEKHVYLMTVLDQMPRLLGLLDRNPLSSTYGCFDRQFWHYNISDTPSARSQEAVLTLGLAYIIDHEKNPYLRSDSILEWLNAGIQFWAKIQEGNGSFNEWYPKENSYVATAFSTYAVSETVLLLKKKIRGVEGIATAITKAGDWLINKDEKEASNQEAGAIAALYNTYKITGKEIFKQAVDQKIKNLSKLQSQEGWFPEYGGADIGYHSVLIDYLSKYFNKSGDRRVLPMLENAIDFIKFFVHPAGTFGGTCGSRNTEYLIPHGFEILTSEFPLAGGITLHIKRSLKERRAVAPYSLDDRYLSYILYTYLRAHLDSGKNSQIQLPFSKTFEKEFKIAGIWIHSQKGFYLIVNCKKGGVFQVSFNDTQSMLYDSGIGVKTGNGKVYSSGWLSEKNLYRISPGHVEVTGYLYGVPKTTISPLKNILFRLFQLTGGSNEKLGLITKRLLRQMLIKKRKRSNLKFKRKIEITGVGFEVTDNVTNKDLKEFYVGGKMSFIYVPSSRYFQPYELTSRTLFFDKENLDVCTGPQIEIKRIYNNMGELLKYTIS